MPIIDIPGVGEIEFPDDMSPDQLNAAAKEVHDSARLEQEMKGVGFNRPQGDEFLSRNKSFPHLLGEMAQSPIVTGALLGVPAAAGIKALTGLPAAQKAVDIGIGGYTGYKTGGVPGALIGAATGARFSKFMRNTEAAEGHLKTMADVATAAKKAKEPGRLVLLPEEVAAAEQMAQIAAKRASEQGTRVAAYGRKGFIRSK